MLAARNLVVTVHHGPVHALDRYAESIASDSSLGVLDAGDLMSGLVDEVIVGYYRLAEGIERDIDRLDEAALRGGRDDILVGIVDIRRRVGAIRRVLAPHRHALAALARPEMEAEDAVGRPWPGLVDRLEGAIDAVDGTRDSLLGTYDIHMGRAAQRANDVMKALTLLSAVLLPAVVLAGIMGMNFELPFFEEQGNFFVVLGAMAAFAVLLLGVARWRRWF
jgi:Mg2+ and Co2+ transporter CorA